MSCYRPLRAFRTPQGQVVFGSAKVVESEAGLALPCGRCVGCRERKSKEWAARCVHEAASHEASSFITLTYSDENLPADYSVDVREFQLFMKKLRKVVDGPIRYFHCGEYGDLGRPHYHALLFGEAFLRDRKLLKVRNGNRLYVSPTLERVWGKGFCPIGDVTFQSAAYVARYTLKKIGGPVTGDDYITHHPVTGEVVQQRPEYATMSRGGRSGERGIGSRWIDEFLDDVFPAGHVVLPDGRKMSPPRYYLKRLEEETNDHRLDPAFLAGVQESRERYARDQVAEQHPARLVVRERVKTNQMKRLRKDIA